MKTAYVVLSENGTTFQNAFYDKDDAEMLVSELANGSVIVESRVQIGEDGSIMLMDIEINGGH